MTILHYTGARWDGGGIHAVIRQLARSSAGRVILGATQGFTTRNTPRLPVWRGPAIEAETINLRNFWRAWRVACRVRRWLQRDSRRVFHGHSRAGLLVGLWLHWLGERRVIVSVHCYGRQKWFYRWAARQLGRRLFWLTPAMRHYYSLPDAGWDQCLPGGVEENLAPPSQVVPGRLRLGGAGFPVAWKRWQLVLEALLLLPPESRARVTFEHIGGPGDDPESQACERALREYTRIHHLDSCVRWRGQEPSSRRLLSEIDVLVVTSHNEPCSIALQEALAAGIPILAAASGGCVDVVTPAVNGRFFRDGDANSLAEALGEWLRHPPAFDPAAIRSTAWRADDVAARWAAHYAAL